MLILLKISAQMKYLKPINDGLWTLNLEQAKHKITIVSKVKKKSIIKKKITQTLIINSCLQYQFAIVRIIWT